MLGLGLLTMWGACSVSTAQPEVGPPDFGGPPPGDFGGFGGFGPGGPGGFMQREIKLIDRFDKDGDKHLNAAERKAAREFLNQQGAGRSGGRRGGPFGRGGFGREQAPVQPGKKISPADVQNYPDAPLYDPQVVRTFFLEFENADWEKELSDFNNTDVEVPAKLTVDGKTYPDVGVHFRGMTSYMMVPEGRKRALSLAVDDVHKDQELYGYNTLHLLNSHEDPTFLRIVLFYQIARDYIPAAKANFVRVVINGENWGIYINAQHFNKDFTRDWFGTTKGERWKVPGSPGGRGSLAYLGEDAAAYKPIYEIKSKDKPKAWADLARLCRVLNETPPDRLEEALAPLLDIDGALRFLALENVLINNDGYWVRSSDYNLYQDPKGQFHVLPQDCNETFSSAGGPGFGGPPGRGGGPGRPGGAGGPGGGFGGPGGFRPEPFLGRAILPLADKNNDEKVTKIEWSALADTWFDKADTAKSGKVNQQQFTTGFADLAPAPQRAGAPADVPPAGGPQGGDRGGRGRGFFGPGMFLAPGIFAAADRDKDGVLTRAELIGAFNTWYDQWDSDKAGTLTDEQLGLGLAAVLPRTDFMGGRGGRGGRGERGGGPGGFGLPRVEGVKLDPLIAAEDPSKPLISRLLAVPALRTRYLSYVRDIAEKWLDWNKLGPIAEGYYALIADDIRMDTRKIDSTEEFLEGLTRTEAGRGFGGGPIGIKTFAEQRRAYLLSHPEIKKLRQER